MKHTIGEGPARMARDDDVAVENLDVLQRAGDKCNAPGQPRPGLDQHLVQFCARGRQRLVDHERVRRRIVEQQHDLGEQAVSGTQVDDASAAKEPPHPPRHLPRLIQLFARQTSGVAYGARHAMKERVVREAIEVPIGQASAGRWREHTYRDIRPCLASANSGRPGLSARSQILRS